MVVLIFGGCVFLIMNNTAILLQLARIQHNQVLNRPVACLEIFAEFGVFWVVYEPLQFRSRHYRRHHFMMHHGANYFMCTSFISAVAIFKTLAQLPIIQRMKMLVWGGVSWLHGKVVVVGVRVHPHNSIIISFNHLFSDIFTIHIHLLLKLLSWQKSSICEFLCGAERELDRLRRNHQLLANFINTAQILFVNVVFVRG